MKDSEILGNRYFYLSFFMAFLVMSVLFLLAATVTHPHKPPSAVAAATEAEAEGYTPSEEDALCVLFIGSSVDDGSAGSYVIARFDPQRGSVPVIALPPQTLVQNGDRMETLGEVFQYGGAAVAKSALESTLGIGIDRYVYMNMDVFVACANTVGNVEFTLDAELVLEQDGVQVVLSQGKQLLDGNKVGKIISGEQPGWGPLDKYHLTGELTAAIVNQRIDVVESTLVDKVFERIINLIDTDISYADYEGRKEAAAYLAGFDGGPAVAIPVSGTLSSDGKTFVLSDTLVAILRQTMG